MNKSSPLTSALLAAALATLALSACNKADDGRTVGQKLDAVVSKTEDKAADAKAEIKKDISDATITASVNAELAKDSSLSALRINVDTDHGNVLLRGTAPDSASRDRATQIAAGVQGVGKVDNQLDVKP